MKKSSILILALLMLPFAFLFAQQIDLKAQYGQKTYDQYLAEDWSGLIATGKEAIEKEVDFYYLRLRMGIAYGAQFNYRMAIVNYKKAIEFVPSDPIAQEYLYYAYLAAGMKNTASIYAASLPISLRTKLMPEKPSFIGNIYVEGGYALSDYEVENTDLTASYFTEKFTRNSQTYFNFNLLLNMANNVSLSLAYTDLSVNSEHTFKIYELPEENEDINVKQRDMYAALHFNDKYGWSLIPFFHNVNTALDITTVEYDTAAYDLELEPAINFETNLTSIQWNDPLLGFGFMKKGGMVDIAASFSYSWLNETNQQQLSASLSYLPMGNYGLYFTPELRLFNEYETQRMIYKMTAGFSLSRSVWVESAFTYGDLRNTHENFGAIVYNLPDKTKYKVDAVINCGLGGSVSLSLRYQLTQKESAITSHSLGTVQTGGSGMGMGSNTTEINWIETTSLSPFKQHFLIFGFNWAI